MSHLSSPEFHDEAAAIVEIEAILWPNGPVCPRCKGTERITRVNGKTARAGLRRCGPCKRQFTVTVGTIFESSHLPMHKWLQAIYLMASSKKGISSHQMMRTLDVQYKTAWFVTHRIREAMRTGTFQPLGGSGKIVESDETFIGRKPGAVKRRGVGHKNAVLSLVERGGEVRSFHVENLSLGSITPIVRANIAKESRLMTDEGRHYVAIGREFASHEWVNHTQDEYVREDVYTNTIEGFFSIFKRGMKGIYQHCAQHNLHRYLSEYDFRYNNRVRLGVDDLERARRTISGARGKRLTFRAQVAR